MAHASKLVTCVIPGRAGAAGRHTGNTCGMLVGLLGVMWSVFYHGMGLGHAQGFFIETQPGEVGETVEFTIHVDQAGNAVKALGFDVRFDANVIEYTGSFSRGETVEGFTYFSVNAPRQDRVQNRVIVAGFAIGKGIETEESGAMVRLQFRVLAPGDTRVWIENMVDNVTGWSAPEAFFATTIAEPATDQAEDVASQSSLERSQEMASQSSADLSEASATLPSSNQTAADTTQSSTAATALSTGAPASRPARTTATPSQPGQTAAGPVFVPQPPGVEPATGTQKNVPEATSTGPASPSRTAARGSGTAQATRQAQPSQDATPAVNEAQEEEAVERYATLPDAAASDLRQRLAEVATQQQSAATARQVPQETSRPSAQGETMAAPEATRGEKLAKVVAAEPVSAGAEAESAVSQTDGFLSQNTRLLAFVFVAVFLCVVIVVVINMKRLA